MTMNISYVSLAVSSFSGCSVFTSDQDYIKQLGYEDPKTRDVAREALIERGSEAVPELLDALNTTEPEVKVRIFSILGEIKDPSSMPTLANLAREAESYDDRRAAEEAIVKMGGVAVPFLLVLLENPSSDDVRACAASLLGKIGDRRAVDPLTEHLDDPSKHVRFVVEQALREMGVLR